MTAATPAGAPLWRRLGLAAGTRVALVGTPDAFTIPDAPAGVRFFDRASEPLDVTIFFTSREQTLRGRMALLEPWLADGGALLIAWPSAESGRVTDLSAGVIAAIGGEHGLVAEGLVEIDATWRAVRLVRLPTAL